MRSSLIIPTRRLRIAHTLERLRMTTTGLDVEVIVVVDVDHLVANAAMRSGATCVFFPNYIGAIAAWNKGLALATGDILVFGADDLVFQQGWLEIALEAHQRDLGGYGLVGFNDLHRNGNEIATHYLFDRKFCREVLGGVMAYSCYEFFCNDTESNARAKRAGRFYWCEGARVQHAHPLLGLRTMDHLDEMHSPMFPRDVAVFERRQLEGFKDDFERVLT